MANTKILHPSKIRMSKTKIYSLLLLASTLSSVSVYYLVLGAELFTPGVAGIAGGFVYTIQDILFKNHLDKLVFGLTYQQFKTTLYWILYGIANIPIIYLMYKWYSRRFFKLSIIYLLTNIASTMVLTYVPGFDLPIVTKEVLGSTAQTLFISLLAGIIYGIAVGLAFKVGACTMGLDPIVRFVSRQKGKNLTPFLFGVSIINSIFWIFIRYFVQSSMGGFSDVEWTWNSFVHKTLLAPEFLGSWLFAATYAMVSGIIYSSTAKAEVFITTDKSKEISDFWNQTNYHRGHTLIEVEGGYTHKKRKSLKMIINLEEMYDVVEQIAALDNQALITVTQLKRVYDIHDWTPMTKDDMDKQKEIVMREEKRKKRVSKKYLNKHKNNK